MSATTIRKTIPVETQLSLMSPSQVSVMLRPPPPVKVWV